MSRGYGSPEPSFHECNGVFPRKGKEEGERGVQRVREAQRGGGAAPRVRGETGFQKRVGKGLLSHLGAKREISSQTLGFSAAFFRGEYILKSAVL